MEEYDKNIDKITQDKRKIESRRKETYNRRKYSEEDIFAWLVSFFSYDLNVILEYILHLEPTYIQEQIK